MNIRDGYFIDSMENAQQSIEENTERKAAQIPLDLDSVNKKYYITDDGNVFFCKIISNRCFIIPKHHVKRKSSERFVKLSIGSRKEIQVTVAQCIYNAFKAKRWLEVRPKYRNGNSNDYTLSNLYIPCEESDMIDISTMNNCTTLYKNYFRNICKHISCKYDLPMQDSEDIVQDAFIFVTCKRDSSDILATWIWYSKKRAIDYLYHIRLIPELRFDIYYPNPEFEFPVFQLLKVKKDREILSMRCRGFNNAEIANALSISKKNVEARVSRAISLIKKILKRDIEYYGKR